MVRRGGGLDSAGNIMGHQRSIAIALAAALLAGAAPPPDYGAEPDWDAARNNVEAALKAKMIDPASTRISWPYTTSSRG